eukprot:NODE_6_length_70510_cov_1.054395.p28 type:complete len:296 gc:universal NODE_6_length_70510_cov_1.054395:49023-49910(+)
MTDYKFQNEIVQMMYVFGETSDPLPAVTKIIEEIVRYHLMEVILLANEACRQRGNRFMSIEDIIFVIKHDKTKVSRIKRYLSYKDVRKNAKDDEENMDVDDAEDQQLDEMKQKQTIRLPWEYIEGFTDILDDEEIDDQIDLVALKDDNQRLKDADNKTKDMTSEEYMFYSECRSASFSHRKGKKFRTWLNMNAITDSKPNDDVVDILGFIGYEMVRRITEFALQIKKKSELEKPIQSASKKEKEDLEIFSMFFVNNKNSQPTPLEECHILEAYRRLQNPVYPHPYKQGKVRTLLT